MNQAGRALRVNGVLVIPIGTARCCSACRRATASGGVGV